MPDDRRSRGRSRSRSPYRRSNDKKRRRSRSRSPLRQRRGGVPLSNKSLPMGAQVLEKHNYTMYKSLFSHYLDIQKNLVLEDLEEREARGRWKSFIGKWNRGELAEGWYDPTTFKKSQMHSERLHQPPSSIQEIDDVPMSPELRSPDEEGENDDDYGPALPSSSAGGSGRKAGAVVPSLQDLELRREQDEDDRGAELADLRQERRGYRKQEQSRLDELAPKAEAGTKERQIEKKREAASANRAFAASKTDGGGAMEVGEDVLMGGGDGMDDYKRQKKDMERKKNERELRREEIFRARQAEREERVRAYREKEEKTMAGLVALAKQKYG